MDRSPVRPVRTAPARRPIAPPALMLRAVIALALALCAALPTAADAHGGRRVLHTSTGPYALEAVVSDAGDLVDETIALTDAATGSPVVGATITAVLERDGDPPNGPFIARPAGDRYEVRYPPPRGDGWTVALRIRGPSGGADARHPYLAPSGGRLWSGRTATILNVLILIAIAATPFILPRLGRRARKSGPRGGAPTARPSA